MPLYTYRCPSCGREQDHFARLSERESSAPECCGVQTVQRITGCMVMVPGGTDISYECPITGEHIQSMRKRKYIMEQHGVVDAREYTSFWKRTQEKRAQEKAESDAYYASLPESVKKTAESTAPL